MSFSLPWKAKYPLDLPKNPGGGGERLVSCVPVCEQKKLETGYFFSSWAMCSAVIILGRRKNASFVGKGYVFFTSRLKRCDKGCLVVTELQKNCSTFPMYTVSVQYAKFTEALESMCFN